MDARLVVVDKTFVLCCASVVREDLFKDPNVLSF